MQDAPPVDIYTAPADPFIVRLFGPANEFGGVVRNGVLDTALGAIPAVGLEDGTEVVCLVRADESKSAPHRRRTIAGTSACTSSPRECSGP